MIVYRIRHKTNKSYHSPTGSAKFIWFNEDSVNKYFRYLDKKKEEYEIIKFHLIEIEEE